MKLQSCSATLLQLLTTKDSAGRTALAMGETMRLKTLQGSGHGAHGR